MRHGKERVEAEGSGAARALRLKQVLGSCGNNPESLPVTALPSVDTVNGWSSTGDHSQPADLWWRVRLRPNGKASTPLLALPLQPGTLWWRAWQPKASAPWFGMAGPVRCGYVVCSSLTGLAAPPSVMTRVKQPELHQAGRHHPMYRPPLNG